jgi:hypothetical protein
MSDGRGIKVNRRIELHMDVLKVNIRISSKLMFSSDKATEVGRIRFGNCKIDLMGNIWLSFVELG